MSRLIAATHPFKVATIDRVVPDGLTLAEMIATLQLDPVLIAHAYVWVGDQLVARENWRVVRPKAGTTITFKVRPGDSGGSGGKSPMRIILMIVVIIASIYTGGAVGAAYGSTAGALAGAAVSVAGSLLINAIAPIRPPSMAGLGGGSSSARDSPSLFIESARNVIRPFSPVPSVLGVHLEVPPLGARSYTEVIGDSNFIRILIVWGYGPLKIDNLKIADTPLTNFEGVQFETREGRPGDAPLTLFPGVVLQDDYAILLTQAADWQTRTAPPGADELSMDFTFPGGLVSFNDQGTRKPQRVTLEIQYREVGSADWLFLPAIIEITNPDGTIEIQTYGDAPVVPAGLQPGFLNGILQILAHVTTTVPAQQLNIVDGTLRSITISANRTSALRHGFRWKVPARGDYEVRTRRTSADTTDQTIFDQFGWTALRTIRNEDPIQFAYPVAKTAIVIRATDQLQSAVDEINATVSSYVDSFGGSPAWSEAVSSNPADLFRHVLQGNANVKRRSDDQIDIPKLEEFHAHCVARGFEFNMIRDFQASVWDTLADIAAAGRASPAQVDGKWTVVIDDGVQLPVQHFTPRNSWGFEAEKSFPEQPDAFRIRFINREQGWRQDERIVYGDGFDATNAEKFEGLEAPGVTDPEHIWKHGRFQKAQAILRPERWTFFADFEHIVARRGNWVLLTHDVLLVGLAVGRIKALTYDGNSPPNVTGMTSDEVLTMEAGENYGVSVRTVDDVKMTRHILTSAGGQTDITFATPIAPDIAPSVGDLFGFGLLGQETIDGILLSIERVSDLSARLVCIPGSPAVYDADTGIIPPFESGVTPQAGVPLAEITAVRSDESVLQLGSGNTLTPHIGATVKAVDFPGAVLEVQIRAAGTGEPFYAANVVSRQGGEVRIGDVEQGSSYDLRVRWRAEGFLPGRWTSYFNHRVVGQSTDPGALINASISVFGGCALIRWERAAELDVRFGGEVRFRHSPETDASLALWQESTSIGAAANGDALFASLPLKAGTYLARVYDKSGRSSEVVALSTKQASVLAFANVDSITESPTFSGVRGTTVTFDGDAIKLKATGLWDDMPDMDGVIDVDAALSDLDSFGGIAPSGTYEFAAGFDFGLVKRVRLTSQIEAISINVLDRIGGRTALMDTWENFDGTTQGAGDARVEVRQSDDMITWGAWNVLDSMEIEARGCEFRVILTTADPAYNIRVTSLGVVAEETV